MQAGLFCPSSLTVFASCLFWSVARSQQAPFVEQRNSIDIDTLDPAAPSPDSDFLPAQIGGIVAAYGISLVLVAITLLSLSKKRREHLQIDDFVEEDAFGENCFREDLDLPPVALRTFGDNKVADPQSDTYDPPFLLVPSSVYSYGSAPYYQRPPVVAPPPANPPASWVDPCAHQKVVAADKAMAQQQLEEMYKLVMEHEEARERGDNVDEPPTQPSHRVSTLSDKSWVKLPGKKHKPSNLNLDAAKEDRSQSKASALFSALLSPKKKSSIRGVSISSPILTPMSASFPHREAQEMSINTSTDFTVPPRPHPPPPSSQVSFIGLNTKDGPSVSTTPDISPQSIQTIDERIGQSLDGRSRSTLMAPSETDAGYASEHSQVPLMGLPLSPKLGGHFPSLPSSPKPGSTFRQSGAPSAVRTNGTLPLRAYEEANGMLSPVGQTTKQTVFERKDQLPGNGPKTPFTANAVPYTPYQPFTPCIPVTPSLVTKEDRKRMKRMVPKTPTLSMVKSSDELW